MKKELKTCESIVHNYDCSQAMGKLINAGGIKDTPENNEMIAKTILYAAKNVNPGNTKVRSYFKGKNSSVILESWWIIGSDRKPYCSTIIVKPVK